MKFQFNKHFYRYSAFYSMIFWTCFFLSDILLDPSQTPAWYSLLACLIIFINAIRVFFFKEEKELTRIGYIFHLGMIALIIFLRFVLGK